MSFFLNIIILLPIVAAIAILFGAPARLASIAVASFNLVISLLAFVAYNQTQGGFQFTSSIPLVADWNLNYSIGLDGLSLMMVLLTTIVTWAAIWLTPKIQKLEPQFYACLLFISAGALGAFSSVDLFFFYAFHELALIPTFLLIGNWGTGNRQLAAWKITIYLALGSFILLIGLIGVYYTAPLGERTFSIPALLSLAKDGKLDLTHAHSIYLFLLVGFGILISLFPFHTWAPQAYASAPTPLAMLHAGVLKKFGLYGLLRVAIPLLPEAAKHWANLLLLLLIGNIIYVGLATIGQKRLDLMLGYSSVMHMGYIFLGIAAMNSLGMSGAALLMFAHGLSIAALFALSGQIRQQTGTLVLSELGGLGTSGPFLGLSFGIAAFASIGLPGFANFASEIMVFLEHLKVFLPGITPIVSRSLFSLPCGAWSSPPFTCCALIAPFSWATSTNAGVPCRTWRPNLRWAVVLLLAVLTIAGFFPQLFLNFITQSVQAFLASR